MDFRISVMDKDGTSVEILHSNSESQYVTFLASSTPTVETQQKLLLLDEKKRTEMLFETANMLSAENIVFNFTGPDKNFPSTIEITYRFFVKEGTAQDFWNTFVKMKTALVLIINMRTKYILAS